MCNPPSQSSNPAGSQQNPQNNNTAPSQPSNPTSNPTAPSSSQALYCQVIDPSNQGQTVNDCFNQDGSDFNTCISKFCSSTAQNSNYKSCSQAALSNCYNTEGSDSAPAPNCNTLCQ